jgi:site-specific DNA-methyltransferase (adenine-specific)
MLKNTIINGNSLEILKTLPDNLVDMVITSPPYWGLRDYGLTDSIYGGDKDCNHEWLEDVKKPSGGKGSLCANVGANRNDFANARDHNIISNFCTKCGAWSGQLGQEPDYHDYLNHLFEIIKECARITKDTGSIWINLGDSYCGTGNKGNYRDPKYKDGRNGQSVSKNRIVEGIKQKSLIGIPDRLKIMMIDNGFICRNEVIWHKPNQMPSSVKDRFTVDFEKFYFFTKNKKYYFEQQLEPYISDENHKLRNRIKEGKYNNTKQFSDGYRDFYKVGGRNKRSVWTINTKPLKEAHFAVYPEELIEVPIKACCPEGGIVLDPFFGSGTTGLVANKQNKYYIGIELNKNYIQIAKNRLAELNDKI